MRPILVIRPEPGNAATVARLNARALDVIALPLFEKSACDWVAPDPGDFTGLLITSASAIALAGPQLARFVALPVHAVGPASARAAEAAGFNVATVGENDVNALLDGIGGGEHLLHLRGEDAISSGCAGERIVYASRQIVHLPRIDTSFALRPIILAHSARAAAAVSALAGEMRSLATLVAISENTAAAAGLGWEAVAIVREPRDEAMIDLAEQLAKD